MKKSLKKDQKVVSFTRMLPSMGLTFIVIGVLIFASTMIWSLKNNILLFTGLFFVIAGIAGYVYSLKQKL